MPKRSLPIVEISFLDHSESPADQIGSLPIRVYGVLVKETAKEYHVVSWVTDGAVNSDQSDGYAIVKHKGVKKRILGRVPLHVA